jgi:Na+:H+ antiporter, NhaA family
LANTAIIFPEDLSSSFSSNNAIGIIAGLVLGKFAGIFIVSWLAVKMKLAQLSDDLHWGHLLGVSLLGGIGFTMSIFITNLAFTDATVVTASKMSILLASVIAAVLGLLFLKTISKQQRVQAEFAE